MALRCGELTKTQTKIAATELSVIVTTNDSFVVTIKKS